MIIISIDGASRRNSKPDCISAGGMFVARYDEEAKRIYCVETTGVVEHRSTNQRGEINALYAALCKVVSSYAKEDVQIITDSEYIFNTLQKGWLLNWATNGWKNSTGKPVKNRDLWEKMLDVWIKIQCKPIKVSLYHTRGHLMSLGKVTGINYLNKDKSGKELFKACMAKYTTLDLEATAKANADATQSNNGFIATGPMLKRLVVFNTMADVIATKYVEEADKIYLSNT